MRTLGRGSCLGIGHQHIQESERPGERAMLRAGMIARYNVQGEEMVERKEMND